jgi:hypothetical protein
LAIYGEAVRRWLADLGVIEGTWRILRFAVPTAAILYYTARIQRAEANRVYSFLGPEELAAELAAAGFTPEPAERSYAGQVVLIRATKR